MPLEIDERPLSGIDQRTLITTFRPATFISEMRNVLSWYTSSTSATCPHPSTSVGGNDRIAPPFNGDVADALTEVVRTATEARVGHGRPLRLERRQRGRGARWGGRQAHRGRVLAAFTAASDAVFAVAAQRGLGQAALGGDPVTVRMGFHSGEALDVVHAPGQR